MSGETTTDEHQAVRLADGRLLGFATYGDAGGPAVLFLHGEVGSRLLGRSLDAVAKGLGLRVVSPDRPGMGFSDFQPHRTIAGWPADVVELTGYLGIGRFAVVSAAAGAPYALACAWKLADRLSATVMAGPVPAVPVHDLPAGTPPLQRLLSESAVRAPWTIRLSMTLLGALTRRGPEQAVARMAGSAGDADRAAFARPEIRVMLAQSIVETFRSGARGPAYDLRLTTADWGLPLGQIASPVILCHGESDDEVPVESARRLAGAIPGCEVRVVPDAGHHLALSHPDVLLEAAGRS